VFYVKIQSLPRVEHSVYIKKARLAMYM